jgi:hypothetical protein
MAASYPAGTKSFSTKVDGPGNTVFAAHINDAQDEIVALENGLRTGIAHDLLPDANNTRALGSVGKTWSGIFTNALSVGGATISGPIVQTTTSTGTVNDFALTAGANVLRCNNATALTITGFAAGYDGQRMIVRSLGAGQVNFSHQAAGSTAANRLINFATSGDTSLAAGVGEAEFLYDATTARWVLKQHEQGAWITPTYAGGNFTGSGGWTVDAGDVTTMAYWLRGRTLTVAWSLVTTTVATGTNLNILNGAWGSFTAAKTMGSAVVLNDNGGGNVIGLVSIVAAATTLVLNKQSAAAWANATNATNTFGELVFEVQ